MWVRYGTGERTHFIHLHIIYKKLDPVFLNVFITANILTGDDFMRKYIVCVWKPASNFGTFDDLRYSELKRSVPLCDLPPTSYSVRGHIQRAFYLTRRCVSVLNHVLGKPVIQKYPCLLKFTIFFKCNHSDYRTICK